jgi:hypothetical protein
MFFGRLHIGIFLLAMMAGKIKTFEKLLLVAETFATAARTGEN